MKKLSILILVTIIGLKCGEQEPENDERLLDIIEKESKENGNEEINNPSSSPNDTQEEVLNESKKETEHNEYYSISDIKLENFQLFLDSDDCIYSTCGTYKGSFEIENLNFLGSLELEGIKLEFSEFTFFEIKDFSQDLSTFHNEFILEPRDDSYQTIKVENLSSRFSDLASGRDIQNGTVTITLYLILENQRFEISAETRIIDRTP